jgi:hypothetical protein
MVPTSPRAAPRMLRPTLNHPDRQNQESESQPRTAHCTIVVSDVAGFGDPDRTNANQTRVRDGLWWATEHAFLHAGIGWDACRREDRGDGILVLAPADIPKPLFADHLPAKLADALRQHNDAHPPEEQINLRVALHAGEIHYDRHGVTGAALIHTFRLLDSATLRNALATSTEPLAIASSSWFYDEVIRHSEQSEAKAYTPAVVTMKETTAAAWIRLVAAAPVGAAAVHGFRTAGSSR